MNLKTFIKIEKKHIVAIAFVMLSVSQVTFSQSKPAPIEFPEWSLPGSKTHKQVPPPKGFHRATVTKKKKIGIFKGQSEVGGALLAGSSSFDAKTGQYTINSAGYNIWYDRDEFRYLWKKMSGDVSIAADVSYPVVDGYFDRKAVLIIRQSLDDDAKEAMVALHGGGLIHLAYRDVTNENLKQMRVDQKGAARLGLEKKGDTYVLYLSVNGEPMKQYGEPVKLQIDGPFYVGIGFCSHNPAVIDTGVLSNLVLENVAGKVR